MPESFLFNVQDALLPNHQRTGIVGDSLEQAVALELGFDNHDPMQLLFSVQGAEELIKGLRSALTKIARANEEQP